MSYAQEILIFLIALTAASGIMYVWFEYISPWREPNKKLKQNVKAFEEDNDRMNVIGQNGNDGLHYDND